VRELPTSRFVAILRAAPAAGLAILLAACLGPVGSPTVSVGDVTTFNPSPTEEAVPEIPAGFPVMPGMLQDDPTPSEPGLVARWRTKASGAEVYTFLEDALPAAGYRVDLLGPGDVVAVIRFTPPGGAQLQIDLGQAGGGTFMELRLPRD
jgi:hypothetical protein